MLKSAGLIVAAFSLGMAAQSALQSSAPKTADKLTDDMRVVDGAMPQASEWLDRVLAGRDIGTAPPAGDLAKALEASVDASPRAAASMNHVVADALSGKPIDSDAMALAIDRGQRNAASQIVIEGCLLVESGIKIPDAKLAMVAQNMNLAETIYKGGALDKIGDPQHRR